jgi:hypothetical protein
MRFLGNPIYSNKFLVRDLIGILLILAIGLGGGFMAWNPIRILAPKFPMLSVQDWPGSHVASELNVSEGWQWEKRRRFEIRMVIVKDSPSRYGYYDAEIWQKAVWYADPAEAATSYQNRSDYYDTQLESEGSSGKDKPTSVLLCSDLAYTRPCTYLAYWRHWQIEVHFAGDEYLSLSEMHRIITRVDQLLLSAPDAP